MIGTANHRHTGILALQVSKKALGCTKWLCLSFEVMKSNVVPSICLPRILSSHMLLRNWSSPLYIMFTSLISLSEHRILWEMTRGLSTVKWVAGMLMLVLYIVWQGEHFKFLVGRVVVERKEMAALCLFETVSRSSYT